MCGLMRVVKPKKKHSDPSHEVGMSQKEPPTFSLEDLRRSVISFLFKLNS